MDEQTGASFTAQLYDVKTKRDGGGSMRLDFGADALQQIQWIQQVAAFKNCAFQIALVPIAPNHVASGGEEFPTDDSGEVVL